MEVRMELEKKAAVSSGYLQHSWELLSVAFDSKQTEMRRIVS